MYIPFFILKFINLSKKNLIVYLILLIFRSQAENFTDSKHISWGECFKSLIHTDEEQIPLLKLILMYFAIKISLKMDSRDYKYLIIKS